MKHKNKILFLAITLATVLILTSAVNATNTTEHNTDHTISEKTSTPATSELKETTINKEKVKTSNKKMEEKTILKENKTEKQLKKDSITIDGVTYTKVIENQIITSGYNEYTVNTYINNATFTCTDEPALVFECDNALINNSKITFLFNDLAKEVKITNSILDGAFANYATQTYIIDCELTENFFLINDEDLLLFNSGGGAIYTNNQELIQKLSEIGITAIDLDDPNKDIENTNITSALLIPETGNSTLTNCNISAKITNNGNLTLINCSLSNNNMTTSGSKTDGFLLENKGNVTMIGCVVENNTFNLTNYQSGSVYKLYGAIVNNGTLNVVNTRFYNNSIGYCSNDKIRIGEGACIFNLATLNVVNSTFEDNQAGYGGSAISGITSIIDQSTLPYKTIYWNTSLNIDNSVFNNNFASCIGGAIDISVSTFSIKNSNFTNNRVDNQNDYSSSPGGQTSGSGAIRIGGNGSITDCEFKNNNVGTQDGKVFYNSFNAGAVSISGQYNMTHCKFINNTAERGAAISTGGSGRIENCIFEDNYAEFTDNQLNSIIMNTGLLNLINNTFTNNYHANSLITSKDNSNDINHATGIIPECIITNNKFTNNSMTANTILIEDKNEIMNWTINNNQYHNTTIDDKIELNLPDYIFTGEPITITGTYTINNPEDYDADITEQTQYRIYLNGRLYQTLDKIEFTITPTNNNMIITVEPTISQTRKAFSIRPLNNITITPENYDEYIYAGTLLGVNRDSKVTFQGTFTDKGEIFINTPDIIIDGSNATFTNTLFTLEASGITIQNMNINNTQTSYPIANTKDNNIITNNTITITNTDGKTAAIYNQANNTIISYNKLIVEGPANTIDHSEGLGIADTQAILLIGGNQNTIEYNNIHVTSKKSSIFGTIEAITNHQEATNTLIQYNNITVGGNGKFNYAIDTLANVENITIQYNNITVTSERYTAGIQTGDGAQNIVIRYNNVTCNCHNNTPVDEEAVAYGIITLNIDGYDTPNQIYIYYNNINIDSSVGYGIELYKTDNTQIHDNNITVKGLQSMGIGCAYSTNSWISHNNIKTSGDSSITLGQVTEEIQPANVGIQIQQESDKANINYNTIQTYDTQAQDTCIYIRSNNAIVVNNKLTSTTKVGDQAVDGQQDTNIHDNTAIQQESSTKTEEEIVLGDSTTLTAQFYDDTYTPVGDGKAIFRVNGKTLRDDQGNVIYADVINGRAELPDVNITQEWMKPDTTIQAVYVGNDNNEPITTTPTTVTVTKPEATIILDAPTEATAGTTITLKATVTDGENNITSGRVAFKLNGKTLKDPKTGKALYANVENGVATITYTIPEKTKAKTYNLTAVFTDTAYDRKEASAELVVAKA